jgi:hypothetical protein
MDSAGLGRHFLKSKKKKEQVAAASAACDGGKKSQRHSGHQALAPNDSH